MRPQPIRPGSLRTLVRNLRQPSTVAFLAELSRLGKPEPTHTIDAVGIPHDSAAGKATIARPLP